MPKVYSQSFQGSPCNKRWYDYFTNLTEHKDLECTVEFCSPRMYVTNGKPARLGLFPVALATNLQCKSTTRYVPEGTDFGAYSLPVHQTTSMRATDEIDPRMLENKIPSMTFEFKVEGVDGDTPLDTLDAILAGFDDKVIRLYRGFCDHTTSLFDENGRWALDYYSGFSHDLTCLGNYKIIDRQFNYDRQTFEITGEHLFFHRFGQDDTYKAMARSGDAQETSVLYQRYPYPYRATNAEGGDASHPIKQIATYKLGYNAWEMMRSPIYERIGSLSVPLYGWGFPGLNSTAYGLSTANITAGLVDSTSASGRWWLYSEADLQQGAQATATAVTRTLDTSTSSTVAQLNNTWKKESALTSLVAWALMNWIHWCPARPFFMTPEETPESRYGEIHDGAWTMVAGKKPDEDCFLDEVEATTWDVTVSGDNGHWFPALENTPYKILPSFMLSQSVNKNHIEWEPVKWVKTYYMDVITTPMKLQTDYYAFQNQTYFADTIDVYKFNTQYWQPFPSDQNAGFRIMTTQPLADDVWYLNRSAELAGAQSFTADMFGFNLPATKQMGQVNIPARGDSVVAWRNLWNTNVPGLANRQPLSIGMIKRDPTIYAYDGTGTMVDEGFTQNTKGIDTIHAYGFYKNLSVRMIERANNGEVGGAPFYELSWDMIDDPSLRVGTSVWVPLQNEYLKVYITKQERTFDGGARMRCTGWCYAKTGQKVYDPKISNAVCTHYVNSPAVDPKGEWFKFSWTPSGDYAVTENVVYTFTYTPSGGSPMNLLSRAIMFGDTPEVTVNAVTLSENSSIALSELTSGNGTFGIKAYFPPNARLVTVDMRRVNVAWNNEEFSYLHAGYVRASNEHQPFVPGNLLQG